MNDFDFKLGWGEYSETCKNNWVWTGQEGDESIYS